MKIPLPQASLSQLLGWSWKAASGVRLRVFSVCLLGVMRVGVSLWFVWVSKLLIDAATRHDTALSELWQLAALLTGLLLLELTFSQASSYVGSLATTRLANGIRKRIYNHLLISDIYTDKLHSGDILNRLTVDVTSVVTTIVSTLPLMVVMAVQLVAAFWLLCKMSLTLALCALVITPICMLASKVYLLKMRKINSEIRESESHIHTNLQEGLQHRVVVQTLEAAPEMNGRLGLLQAALFGSNVKRARISLFSRSMVRLGFIAGYLIAFIWSAFQLHAGVITFGIMTAFLQLVARIQNPISSLSNSIPGLVGTATAIDRLMDLEKGKHTEKEDVRSVPLSGRLGVRCSDVTFGYSDGNDILTNFSYDFKPGSKTVIMGETGVGKSTLVKLILALVQPREGAVEIYGDNDSHIVSAALRCNMVYVPQGNSLLEGSIRSNLMLGNPDATDAELREALHIAAADFVYDLPEGLETPCGELGSSLSEGQCQRIAIARALLRRGNLLILDEFNSSLDETTAAILMERLIQARPDATIIFISHRPEAVRAAKADVLRLVR